MDGKPNDVSAGIPKRGVSSKKKPYKKARTNKQKLAAVWNSLKHAEPKFIENHSLATEFTALTTAPIAGAAGVVLLNPLLRGTAVQNRIGDAVRFYRIAGTIALQDIADNVNHARVMIVAVKNNAGQANQFFAQATATAAASTGYLFRTFAASVIRPWQAYNFTSTEIAKKFNVIFDKEFVLGNNTTDSSPSINIDLPLNFTTSYTLGNNGDVTDIDNNALYLAIWAGSVNVFFGYHLNVFYEDK